MQCSGKLKGSAKYRIHEWAINDWFEPIAGLNRNRQACGGGGAFYFIMLIILANIVGMANGKQQPEKIHRSVSIDEKLNFEEKKKTNYASTHVPHTLSGMPAVWINKFHFVHMFFSGRFRIGMHTAKQLRDWMFFFSIDFIFYSHSLGFFLSTHWVDCDKGAQAI